MIMDSRRQPSLGTGADQPRLGRGFCPQGLQSARETCHTLDDTISYKYWRLSGVQGGTDRKKFLRAARLQGSPKKHPGSSLGLAQVCGQLQSPVTPFAVQPFSWGALWVAQV